MKKFAWARWVVPAVIAIVLAIGFIYALVSHNAFGQTVSEAVIEREQQRIEATRKQTFDAAHDMTNRFKGAMPSDSAIDAQMQKLVGRRDQQMQDAADKAKHDGNVFPTIPTPEVAHVDPVDVAKRYEARVAKRATDSFVAFASFSMPPESLTRLVRIMGQAGGTVVMRGFKDDSLKATAAQMQVLGLASGGVVVNPKAFQKYQIDRVPAYVLTKGGETDGQVDSSGCALPDAFVRISGDVSPAYALHQIIDHSPAYRPIAERYLRPIDPRIGGQE